MEHDIVKHDTNYPPEASTKGDNAYYLRGCDEVQRSPSYASCLHKIKEHEAGRWNSNFQECVPAMKAGKCQAQGMRQAEQLAGVALYYFPRRPPAALHLPVSVSGDFGVRITNLTDPALIPKTPNSVPTSRFMDTVKKVGAAVFGKPTQEPGLQIDTGSYADALNAAPSEPTPKPAPKPLTKEDLAKMAQPGESLIDVAKRLLNKNKETA